MSLYKYIEDRIDVAETVGDIATIYYIISSLKSSDAYNIMLWASKNDKRLTMQSFIKYFNNETTSYAPVCVKAAYDKNHNGIVKDMLDNEGYRTVILTNIVTAKIALLYIRMKKIDKLLNNKVS